MKILTIIIPVRWSNDRSDILKRLDYIFEDNKISNDIQILVVDDGSEEEYANLIKNKCESLNCAYSYIDSELQPFSIGRARNFGVMEAQSKYVMFQDADLVPYPGFYQDVINEISIQKLDRWAERFLMFGVVYLTKSGTKEFFDTPPSLRKNAFLQYLLEDETSKIEKFSTGTSVTVWRRDHYLCTGGNDPEFQEWGFEDLEYACRAIRRSKKFPLPEQFALDFRNFQSISDYKGWKSIYRLFGDMTFQKGMVLFHAWHPIEQNSDYIKGKERNKRIFEKKLAAFRDEGTEPPPLLMKERGKSLLFRSNPWVLNRWTAPYLGEITVLDEDYFTSESVIEYIRKSEITRVVFHNPYSNEKIRSIYDAVRENNIEFLVCERGALPDSIFFDHRGFNADSSSYDPQHWNYELKPDERRDVVEYIRKERFSENHLEQQKSMIGVNALRKKLNIAKGKKVLVVPLQRPSDTVIQFMSGPIGSYDNFLSLLKELTWTLPIDWVIVAKKHPLETIRPDIENIIFSDDENVKDLLELADAVLVINSGVGLMALMYGKPVLCAGSAFYCHQGLAFQVNNAQEVILGLSEGKPEQESVLRFYSYLLNRFYSFGKFKTKTVPWGDTGLMTATTAIDFYKVRMPGQPEMSIEMRNAVAIKTDSILFDRYRTSTGEIRNGILEDVKKSTAVVKPKLSPPATKAVSENIIPIRSSGAIKEGKYKNGTLQKKLKKLRTNPKAFLQDSNVTMLRMVGGLIRTK